MIEIRSRWNSAVIRTVEADSLRGADLSGTDLSEANFSGADLRGANLRGANLREANLSEANLREANLSEANLSGADLSGTDLIGANLSGADLRGANLRWANLSEANLSGAKGLLSATDWIGRFATDSEGVLVYKRFGGGSTQYSPPETWKAEEGAILTEVVNPLPTDDCGCGVNFGTLDWCQRNYTSADLWLCRIAWLDLAGVVVPYNTDGKARCERLTLLYRVDPETGERLAKDKAASA